jgi:monofunctional biosynthetic peptidoglycan transglycosylase
MGKNRHLNRCIYVSFVLAILPLLYFSILPDVSKLRRENPKKTAYMEYREREWQKKGRKQRIQQRWVPLSAVSPYLVKAVLIAEDDKFWTHEGFDYVSIEKAFWKDLETMRFKLGGSTISQQLARNLYLCPEKSLPRKIGEAFITWRMEKALSKKRILELYLNVVEWGEGIFGVEAASRHYFGKPAFDLTPQEAARLASVLPNPKRYDPAGNQRYVLARSNLIYRIMIHRGVVVEDFNEGIPETRPSVQHQ